MKRVGIHTTVLIPLMLVLPLSYVSPRLQASSLQIDTKIPNPSLSNSQILLIPFVESSQVNAVHFSPIQEVSWTTSKPANFSTLAMEWGIPKQVLHSLNPQFNPHTQLPSGTELRVYQRDPSDVAKSLGFPNRGRLAHGVPLPEEDAWYVRDSRRRRLYGTQLTISSLVQAFQAFSQQFPDAPPIRVGDLSYRKGGRISPHQSHQSGRDVDIGYFHKNASESPQTWIPTTLRNFDSEKTWSLIHELIKTGNVQTIYMDRRLQIKTYQVARAYLPEAELQRLFQYPKRSASSKAIIRHWRGHDHHMHVRFRCTPSNTACRAQSRPPLVHKRAGKKMRKDRS